MQVSLEQVEQRLLQVASDKLPVVYEFLGYLTHRAILEDEHERAARFKVLDLVRQRLPSVPLDEVERP